MGAIKTTSMIMLLVAGSAFLTLAMGFTGLPRGLAKWIGAMNLSPWMLIAVLALFYYIVLGFFLDGISSIVLTLAVVEPLVRGASINMIWCGIFVVLVAEMAMITPPVGFNLFLVQSMTGRDLGFIARAALPMFLLMVLGVVLLTVFPGLALWLARSLDGARLGSCIAPSSSQSTAAIRIAGPACCRNLRSTPSRAPPCIWSR